MPGIKSWRQHLVCYVPSGVRPYFRGAASFWPVSSGDWVLSDASRETVVFQPAYLQNSLLSQTQWALQQSLPFFLFLSHCNKIC